MGLKFILDCTILMADPLLILPYTAVSFSIVARMIFLYLLYTKRSTNIYSLAFSYLSILSSSLWIPYGIIVQDTPHSGAKWRRNCIVIWFCCLYHLPLRIKLRLHFRWRRNFILNTSATIKLSLHPFGWRLNFILGGIIGVMPLYRSLLSLLGRPWPKRTM
jgi:hypothetical protein